MSDYARFIERKAQLDSQSGFKPLWIPDFLFDFQKALVEWAILQGRCALFEECGLGKTAQELVWAENVVRRINKPVLILTPLAVGAQFVREGEKFGIDCEQSRDGKFTKKIVIANYERLHYFNHNDFTGVVCDESSILKNYDGKTKSHVTEFMRQLPYRLLASATPAPNDFVELGTSSEALGHLGHIEMLGTFFKADNDSYAQGGGAARRYDRNPTGGKFRFRGHAEREFWRWVCSWARAIRKPSDLGFDDGEFILPELTTRQHIVESRRLPEGFLFSMPASNLFEQREEQRRTLVERCEKVAELVNERGGYSLAWCHLNDEGDLLEKLIQDCVQISGSDSIEFKEETIDAFQRGQIRRLTTKGDCAGFGLNFQHCNHQTFFPSHSFEQWHQCIRRSWRFGQKNAVEVDLISTEGQSRTLANLKRKEAAADRMFAQLVELMNDQLRIKRTENVRENIQQPSFLK